LCTHDYPISSFVVLLSLCAWCLNYPEQLIISLSEPERSKSLAKKKKKFIVNEKFVLWSDYESCTIVKNIINISSEKVYYISTIIKSRIQWSISRSPLKLLWEIFRSLFSLARHFFFLYRRIQSVFFFIIIYPSVS
jgi:hypothetical protein